MVCAYLPIISNLFISLELNSLTSFFAVEMDSVGTSLLILMLYVFAEKFCFDKEATSIVDKAVIAIMGFDIVNVIVNGFTRHMFYPSSLENEVVFTDVYDIHLACLYFGVIAVFLMFAYKSFTVPKSYRLKYLWVFWSYAATILWETYYIIVGSKYDMSLFGYGFCAILIYYSAVEYKPKSLLDRMKEVIVSSSSDGLIFYDVSGRLIYANSAAGLLLNAPNDDLSLMHEEIVGIINDDHESLKNVNDKNYECSFVKDGEKNYWVVSYHKLFEDTKLIGGFIKISDRTEEHARLEQERYLAMYDTLTGIYNKDFFYQQVRKTLDSNVDVDYVAIASDIKEFKLVNDRYGRDVGDGILRKIADVLRQIPGTDNVYGRVGVDKFAILMRKEEFIEEKFIKVINNVPALEIDTIYPIIIHSGIYEIEKKDLRESVVFDRAFLAIKGIKNDLTKKIAYYDDKIRDDLLWEQRVARELDEALKTKQIVPYLQAQVNSKGHVEGAEALVRWIHPEMGFLNPGRFISVLEKNGTIVKLDMYMWESACQIIRKWTDMGQDKYYISVNISPKDFYLVDVANEIISLVNKYQIDPSRLRLEITETIIMNDIDKKIETINQLRDYGFIVEMDDFGSGYSSLNLLKELPVDVLKLDMLFIKDKNHIEKTKRIMKLIIDLAKDLDIPVIAEGVEEEDQVRYLTEMGCDFFQGYYFARPESLDDYERKNILCS